jgi:hypothetical protein
LGHQFKLFLEHGGIGHDSTQPTPQDAKHYFSTKLKGVRVSTGHREAFFITRPSIHPSVRQEDEEENVVTAAAVVTR